MDVRKAEWPTQKIRSDRSPFYDTLRDMKSRETVAISCSEMEMSKIRQVAHAAARSLNQTIRTCYQGGELFIQKN